MSVRINLARLKKNMEELAQFGALDMGGISRPAFSKAHSEARTWLLEKMSRAGLFAHSDPVGNVWGLLESSKSPVVIGSHIDTVANGGMFDGALGVLAGLECIQTIKENSLPCPRSLELVAFTDEEGAYLSLMGSRCTMGKVSNEEIADAKNTKGLPLVKAMAAAGLDAQNISAAKRDPDSIHAYLELHIEQGPVLDSANIPIGVVRSIVGIDSYWLTFSGEANHAGTTPMNQRRDALSGAVEFHRRINAWIRLNPGGVVTIGRMDVMPGAFNVVPGSVKLSLEFRHSKAEALEKMASSFLDIGNIVAKEMDLDFTAEHHSYNAPVSLDHDIVTAIQDSADELGYTYQLMDSGAGHDAQVMALKTKAGMIFVPSIGGKSHCPEERSDWQDTEKGVQLLLNSILKLAMD